MKTRAWLIPDSEVLATKVDGGVALLGVTDNSAKVSPGSAFFAVRGTQVDGHRFLPVADTAGAAVAVVEDRAAFEQFPRTVLVPSVRRALALAAARWFDLPTRALRLVGITGTNGKTTSAYLMKSIWDSLGSTCGLVGTVECRFADVSEPSMRTTPDPLALQSLFSRMQSKGVTHAVMEVTSIGLDQERVAGCEFDVALFTNLTQDHLDYHGDFESYYQAKLRLFREYALSAAIINVDDSWGRRLWQETGPGIPRLSFSVSGERGAGDHSDFAVWGANFEKSGTLARVRTPDGDLELRLGIVGRHNLYNALGVLAVSYALGHELERSARALSQAGGAPGRLERVMNGEGYPSIFVDYAHTDDALLNVLRFLRELRGEGPGRILTVFGCGGDRDRTKRPLMARVASTHSDVTIATSDNPRTEDPERIIDEIEVGVERGQTVYHREGNRREAIHWALSEARPEDLVLVAGKGHETYQIIGDEQFPFDDREVIRDYYRNVKN